MEYAHLIENIMDFIFNQFGQFAELKVGVWNESEEPAHTIE